MVFGITRYLSINKSNTLVKDGMKKSSNIMFVVAHPDDECMFFGPAITALTLPSTTSTSVGRKKAKNVYLLCLSDGIISTVLNVSIIHFYM